MLIEHLYKKGQNENKLIDKYNLNFIFNNKF